MADDLDLDELREKAEDVQRFAPPPWVYYNDQEEGLRTQARPENLSETSPFLSTEESRWEVDLAHIPSVGSRPDAWEMARRPYEYQNALGDYLAAADPSTVLALIDRIQELEEAIETVLGRLDGAIDGVYGAGEHGGGFSPKMQGRVDGLRQAENIIEEELEGGDG